MAHRVDPARIRGRVHAVTGIAVVLSLFGASVAEASHSHEDEDGSAAECAACLPGKTPGHATASFKPRLTGLNRLPAPTTAESRMASAARHFRPRRSRAPPPSVSL